MKTYYKPTHEEITNRAQKIWNEQGRPAGKDDVIWLQAEQQLQGQERSSLGKTKAAPRRTGIAPNTPTSLEQDADPINNDPLEERLSTFGQPPARGATSL